MSTEIDDGLTEEERAALMSDDDAAGDAPAADPEAEPAEQAPEAAASEAPPEASAAADQPAQEPVEEAKAASPILVASPVEDAEARLTDIATKKDALLEQFDEGEITAKEYQKQLDALAKEERAIERAQDRAELAAQMEQQRLQNDWTATCNSFVESNPIYKDNPRLYKALDAEVRELAAKPETANWSGQKFLDEAHKALKTAFGLPDAKPAAKEQQRQSRELPPNLAKVPAANIEDTSGGRFAVLDRLANSDPIAYEEAINKMPQSERDAYLAA
jgi:chromosome segregation ATPase